MALVGKKLEGHQSSANKVPRLSPTYREAISRAVRPANYQAAENLKAIVRVMMPEVFQPQAAVPPVAAETGSIAVAAEQQAFNDLVHTAGQQVINGATELLREVSDQGELADA